MLAAAVPKIWQRLLPAILWSLVFAPSLVFAESPSPNGVKTLDPPGAIKAQGTWSLGARAGDFVFVAGMQGVDPATNKLVEDPQARILRAFLNIKLIAESEGASLHDCVRLTVYVSDLRRFAPMVDKAQAELWGKPPYPPRTMVEVQRLFDDDIVEIDSVFYAPRRKSEPASHSRVKVGLRQQLIARAAHIARLPPISPRGPANTNETG